jgi:hypothetical protein
MTLYEEVSLVFKEWDHTSEIDNFVDRYFIISYDGHVSIFRCMTEFEREWFEGVGQYAQHSTSCATDEVNKGIVIQDSMCWHNFVHLVTIDRCVTEVTKNEWDLAVI